MMISGVLDAETVYYIKVEVFRFVKENTALVMLLQAGKVLDIWASWTSQLYAAAD